jgi:hypothetical protein
MLPTNVQARRVIWDAVDRETGRPVLERVFPPALVKDVNKSEMSIVLKNAMRWYAVGSDNYNHLVGSDPLGVVFSEYSLADPSAWNYIRPILAENGGWALFLYTPRGRNHGYSLFNMAAGNPEWFCELLTIEQTKHITMEDVEAERRAGMEDALLRQEFWCSFTALSSGAFYAKELEAMRSQGRITHVPYDSGWPLELWFDLGYNDQTAVWAMQPRGMKLCAVRYQEWKNASIPVIARDIRKWNWNIDLLRLPHDGEQHDQTSGRTRKEVWEDELACVSEITQRPKNKEELQEQVAAVRSLLPSMFIDGVECEQGIYALESYERKWDEKTRRHRDQAEHNWASHGADALRTGAVKHAPGAYGYGEDLLAGGRRATMRSKPRVLVKRGGQKSGYTPRFDEEPDVRTRRR